MAKRKTYSAFRYQEGKDVAIVEHFNILKASKSRRETVAKGLKAKGIKKILANGKYFSIDTFLNLNWYIPKLLKLWFFYSQKRSNTIFSYKEWLQSFRYL